MLQVREVTLYIILYSSIIDRYLLFQHVYKFKVLSRFLYIFLIELRREALQILNCVLGDKKWLEIKIKKLENSGKIVQKQADVQQRDITQEENCVRVRMQESLTLTEA